MKAKPNRWSVPREWKGERCFILAGGASLQTDKARQLRGRIIAIKQCVYLRPDADVMLVSGRDDAEVCREYFEKYKGPNLVCRSPYPGFPERTLFLTRTKDGAYSRDPRMVGGLDAGSTAINLAALFGAKEIVLLGMDMTGGRWVKHHHLPTIPKWHFDLHLAGIARMAGELARDRIRVVNCSPISRITQFEKRPLEEFL